MCKLQSHDGSYVGGLLDETCVDACHVCSLTHPANVCRAARAIPTDKPF